MKDGCCFRGFEGIERIGCLFTLSTFNFFRSQIDRHCFFCVVRFHETGIIFNYFNGYFSRVINDTQRSNRSRFTPRPTEVVFLLSLFFNLLFNLASERHAWPIINLVAFIYVFQEIFVLTLYVSTNHFSHK